MDVFYIFLFFESQMIRWIGNTQTILSSINQAMLKVTDITFPPIRFFESTFTEALDLYLPDCMHWIA